MIEASTRYRVKLMVFRSLFVVSCKFVTGSLFATATLFVVAFSLAGDSHFCQLDEYKKLTVDQGDSQAVPSISVTPHRRSSRKTVLAPHTY